ncbi:MULTISPECIES: SRPBCC family protein [Amycolatopsis]|uniref:SRPBCC family protein n=1 Tax=Amycolatopsis thermalba TaxID=944492 RepID=A0ABY4P1I5_9PSEU|nr:MULTISPECIES: SRPBCC family protein [Amycolatopsis]OXM61324.1 dimethyladenosine transferase [Amycolatopsis sp. KNN50.9b]UQS26159.1 SRPBCC family protein [Amycolatopsis thermalba]
MKKRQVSATRIVAAPPEKIFELLTDPSKHPLIDGSGTVLAAQSSGPERLTLGSRFGMDMKMGAPYKILNTVVEYDENRLIAWRHFNGHRWRWQLTPLEDGSTEVTETFDWSTARIPLLIDLSFFPRKNKQAIDKTLDRLVNLFQA